jgi:hypothetical protein
MSHRLICTLMNIEMLIKILGDSGKARNLSATAGKIGTGITGTTNMKQMRNGGTGAGKATGMKGTETGETETGETETDINAVNNTIINKTALNQRSFINLIVTC